MPWNKNNYPASMKNLPVAVRNKAVEIANALLEEGKMEEGIAIATGISRAKDWAANRGKPTETKASRKTTDKKIHGEDRYVMPADNGWDVKKEKSSRKEHFATKREAVQEAKKKAKKANASITVKGNDGKVQERLSFNERKQGK